MTDTMRDRERLSEKRIGYLYSNWRHGYLEKVLSGYSEEERAVAFGLLLQDHLLGPAASEPEPIPTCGGKGYLESVTGTKRTACWGCPDCHREHGDK